MSKHTATRRPSIVESMSDRAHMALVAGMASIVAILGHVL